MEFIKNFKSELIVESPGRINLIGEHTDYNMGFVLPTAIEKKIVFQFAKNESPNKCQVYSTTFNTGFELDLNTLEKSSVEWENYILGVLNEISKRTNKLSGFNCTIESNLPTGSGLSSSAALECGLAFGLNDLFDLGLSKMEMVKLSQIAEHTYAGTQCGIMDQFASVMSQKGHMLLLDCRTLEYKPIPINLEPYKIILLNTKVSHNLATSEYNTRKNECEEGVAILKQDYPEVNYLRDASMAMLEGVKERISETVYNRCSFIIAENKRVHQMAAALTANDLETVGQILYKAHEGISKFYEVSCAESDFLVEFSKSNIHVLGARQTGGGFGGCTLNIVHKNAVDDFVNAATQAYREKFNIELDAFEVKPSTGTFSYSN
ncbi:galactokinase [Aurantibacter sp.]|uniref:galactokinase n=1 Tax=Aurantibacter sp. TaxID=2807103 RepID=UPI0032644C4E